MSKLKVILIGYKGKMGQCVSNLLAEDELVAGIDLNDSIEKVKIKANCIIDFSTANSRLNIIKYAAKNQIPLAIFSTNVNEADMQLIKESSKIIPILICPNASIGINILFNVIENLAKNLSCADVVLTEYHNKTKKDSPSGTAKVLINLLKEHNLVTSSFRVGDEIGQHKIEIYLAGEKLTIAHQAFSREVFAVGALKMCEKLIDLKNGLYYKLD